MDLRKQKHTLLEAHLQEKLRNGSEARPKELRLFLLNLSGMHLDASRRLHNVPIICVGSDQAETHVTQFVLQRCR